MAIGSSRALDRGATLQRFVLALPVAFYAMRAWQRRWVTDDGFINFRIVEMVQAGHGPVFNVGERVESATSTLWLWTLVAGDLVLPLRLEYVAVLLGGLLAVAGLGLTTWGSVLLHRTVGAPVGGEGDRPDDTADDTADDEPGQQATWPARPLLVPAGALALAVLSPLWDYATSGLEGGLTFAWIGLTCLLVARWAARQGPEGRLGLGPAAVIGLGPLVRPDLGLVTIVVLAGVVLAQWRDDSLSGRARLLAAAFALPVAYQVFRMGYYAALVPNTALAKGAERSRWAAGWSYLRDLVGPYRLTIPAVLLALAVAVPLVRRAAATGLRPLVAVIALPVAGLLDILYVVRAGGDYMHGRLLLPGLWALLAPFAVTPLPAWRALRAVRPVALARAALLAGFAVWAGVCAGMLRHERTTFGGGTWVVEGRQLLVTGIGVTNPVTIADHGWGPNSPYRRLPPADAYMMGVPLDIDAPDGLRTPVYASFGVGAPGFGLGTNVYILDMLGLGDPLVSRFRVDSGGIVAHEKGLPRAWQAALLSEGPLDPDLLEDPGIVFPLYLSPDGELERDIIAAREALQCEPIQDLYDAVRDPLTPGRFLENIVAAPHLTFLRIPPAPTEAADDLCD